VVPPFPFDDDETFESFSKNACSGNPPADEIHIETVKQLNDQCVVAGTSGVILIVVGLGQTMKQAQAQV
jgi:phosphoribosylamine--glycine ligase